jgi:membrane-associated phospholipid phosphatase
MRIDRGFLLTLLTVFMLIPVAMLAVDRPFSTWSYANLHGVRAFVWLTWIVDPVMPLSTICLAATGVAAAFGWRPGYWGRTLIACALAALVAIALKDELKYVFGRPWPETWVNNNPSWIRDGVDGFYWFHGGPGWASFPSGHTTAITAPCAVLWRRAPALRVVWATLVAAVVAGLLGADYHYVADTLAGLFLGISCAAGIVALCGQPGARVTGDRSETAAAFQIEQMQTVDSSAQRNLSAG